MSAIDETTTIDSLQIEIQSNSTNAAEGISALATSLGKLKSNGSIGVAVKNLNNLSKALKDFTPVASNAKKLGSLADAVSKLSNAGSFARVINQLHKLPSALKGLENMELGGIDSKFDRIASASSKLSNIKSSGLSSMVNSLGKLGDVTKSLDDDTINAFANKIEKLNDKLAPLSTKMVAVSSGFRTINTNASKASTGVANLGSRVNVTTLNLATMITTIQGVVSALRPIIGLLSSAIGEAIEWDGIASRFGRGFGEQASDVYSWIQKLNKEMDINVQQFMQYSSTYASMLTGYGLSSKDASNMALGYMELTYDIWAGYNDIYKSLDDAAIAVRSAIASEVEPIRKAGITITQATLKETAANYGLEISIENMTEAQKSYLIYLTMVDKAYAQNLVGSYARELNTAEGQMRTFRQQLKSLAQSFGALFLPILVKIMPWLQAFVELLGEAIIAVAEFFGVEIQKVDFGSVGDSLGNIGDSADKVMGSLDDTKGTIEDTTKAIKDLKNATIGIDELNVISPPSNPSANNGAGGWGEGWGDGSGSSGILGNMDHLWDDSIFAGIENKVDAIKEKFKEWLPIIETIGLALAALGIAKLLNNIGDALGQMDMLGKVISSIAIATIEAALVFKLADDYLESGDILSLVGEAVVTALGSYLLYKTWGDKGLVLGLAVSIVAQLGAIVWNLADGGVKMDDPQLWIQSAFTSALSGVAGGWMAYKGLIPLTTGQGIGIGLLVGLSLTLSAITIGDVTANGVEAQNVLTGALSTLIGGGAGAAIFTALGIATGGTGFLVGAAIMLAVNVVGALIGSVSKEAEMSMQEDLESRFGEIELSIEEIRVVIDKLMPEWTDDVLKAADVQKAVESLAEQLEIEVEKLERLEWQVSVGLDLTEKEISDYKATIESFVSTTQQYIKDRGYALEVGLKATGASDFTIDTSNMITNAIYDELTALGTDLQETVNAAYEDGLLDIDELKAIQTIRNDMMEIVNALKTSEIEAEFSVLEMKFSGVDLTPESFNTMMAEWATTLNEKVKPALESTVKENLKTLQGNVAFAKMQLEKNPGDAEAKQMLEDAEKALQDYVDQNPLQNLLLEANVKAVTFAINTLQEAFAEEIARVEEAGYLDDFGQNLKFALELYPDVKFDDGDGEIYGNIEILTASVQSEMEKASESMSKSARKNLEKMLESIKPTMADFEDIAEENRKAGVTVTQSIRDGLNDYNELRALSGDVEGINYLIGKGFSTDSVFLNTLATVEGAGKQVDKSVAKGLLNNIDYVTDEATGLVVGIKDAVTGETVHLTPILEGNLSTLGVNLGDALGGEYQYVYDSTTGVLQSIVDSTTGNQVWVNDELKTAGKTAGGSLSDGVLEGAESSMEKSKKSWLDWAIWPWNWFKEENEINSPSKLFERGGKYLTDGLVKGMSLSSLTNKLKDIWNNAKTWWETKKGNLSTYVPSIGDIKSKVSSAWNTAKTWYNTKKSAMSTYTPNIGSIYEKVKVRWDNARTWYNSKKSKFSEYTPSIGSIYEKVKGRWDNAREWYNKKKSAMKTYTPSIGSIKDKLVSAWNTAKSWWNKNVKLSIPSLSFKVTYTTSGLGAVKKAIVNALNLPGWPKLSFAKNGGIFDAGSLIWAGEAGAEIVANAGGGKTGVMNVDQMKEAVYEGVYAAVIAAMRATNGGSGEQAVNVYLDSKQITSSVEKRQRERGASIMGSQVYSY